MSTTAHAREALKPSAAVRTNLLQRKCDLCIGKRRLQRSLPNNQSTPGTVPPLVYDVLRSLGQPLDRKTQAFMEPRFRHDFSQVKVHADANAAESAKNLNALAYTVGRNVVFGYGRYAPETVEGQKLIAHELTHVIQQRSDNIRIEPGDHSHEREADYMADAIFSDRHHPVSQMIDTGRIIAKKDESDDGPPRSGWEPVNVMGFIPRADAYAEKEVDQPQDGVFFNGKMLIIRRNGELMRAVSAVSGNPSSKEYEAGVGPIPDKSYSISPHITNPTVNRLQGGVCGANAINSGFQELTSNDPSPCSDPSNHYCNTSCPTDTDANRRCFTPVDCWGRFRIKIEGSASTKKPGGGTVTRSGFYIHGGNHGVTVTSGCIKVFDDSVFSVLREFKRTVPLAVKKV